MGDNMYCGIGPVPKGKVRGTPEYCIQTNQIRYYGLVAIDPSLLKKAKGSTSSLIKEQLKLKKLTDDAKILIKDVKNIKVILDDDRTRPAQQKKAQKRMDELLAKRDRLTKRLKAQQAAVEALEQEEASEKKKSSKTKGKSKGKSTKKVNKSGSKTSRKLK